MIRAKLVTLYICMFQVIYRQLTGTLAATVSINQNITRLLGSNDTHLTCSFIQKTNEPLLSVEIIAKNKADNFDDKKPIAIFQPERKAKLYPLGAYLSGRVILTNITHTSTNATLSFHVLSCADEKDYLCKYNFYDMGGAISAEVSESTRILVKVPVSDVHIIDQPHRIQYDRKTDNITLTCKASGDPEPEYTWFKDDKNDTTISKTKVYVIDDVIQNNSGVYICEAFNTINGIYYTQSTSVEIDIVDELLPLRKSASSKFSAAHAAFAVPLIIAVGFVVICIAREKHRYNRSNVGKKEENHRQNMNANFMSCHSLIKKIDYTCTAAAEEEGSEETCNGILKAEVSYRKKYVDKKNEEADNISVAPEYISFDTKNNTVTLLKPAATLDVKSGMEETKNCNTNKSEVNPEETVDLSHNRPTSSDIYAVPSDTLTAGIAKDQGKYEDHGAFDEAAVYSEVFNQTNMKYEMSKVQTSIPPGYEDHNGEDVSANQCHAHILRPVSG